MRRRALLIVLVMLLLVPLLHVEVAAEPVPVAPATETAIVDEWPVDPTAIVGEGVTSEPLDTPIAFSAVGFAVPADADVWFRTSRDGVDWSSWEHAAPLGGADGPDPGSAEDEASAAGPHSALAWVGEARLLQVTVVGGDLDDVEAHLIDSMGLSRGYAARTLDAVRAAWEGVGRPTTAHATDSPQVVTRSEWGADESYRSGRVAEGQVRHAIVHHTATSNTYSREQAPGVVRAIYRYHTKTLGWDDIGYNALVDRYGTVYEGRYGGLHRPVIGAHARGFNSESVGMSVIGTFDQAAPPSAAREALARMLGWKLAIHGVDARSTVRVTSRGSDRYAAGTQVRLPAISGHRSVGHTACPGDAFLRTFSALRERTAEFNSPFTDVAWSHAHFGSILRAFVVGVMRECGDNRFCPQRAVTRGEMATMVARAVGLEPKDGMRFVDVLPLHPHAGSINAVADAGLAAGCDVGRYCPDELMTRAQMASFLVQAAASLSPADSPRFSDVPADAVHARNIAGIARAGVTTGCRGNRFCPTERITRGQLATFLVRVGDLGW